MFNHFLLWDFPQNNILCLILGPSCSLVPRPTSAPRKVGLITIRHSARLYCAIVPDDGTLCNVIYIQRLCECAYEQMYVLLGGRWMVGWEAFLLVSFALHRWHQHEECCIRQSQQTRKLDCSSYSLSLVQHTTSISNVWRQVPHWMNTHVNRALGSSIEQEVS